MTACPAPALRGCVARGRLLQRRGALATLSRSPPPRGQLSLRCGIPQPPSGRLTPAGSLPGHPPPGCLLRRVQHLPWAAVFQQLARVPLLRERRPPGSPPAGIVPVPQGSIGLMESDSFRWLSLGLEPGGSQAPGGLVRASAAGAAEVACRLWWGQWREAKDMASFFFFFKIV